MPFNAVTGKPHTTVSPSATTLPRAAKRLIARPQRALLLFAAEWRDVVADELHEILARIAARVKTRPDPNETVQRSHPIVVDDGEGPLVIEEIPFRSMLEILYYSRTLREVLWILDERRAGSFGEVSQILTRIPWAHILPQNTAVTLRTRLASSHLNHEGALVQAAVRSLGASGLQISDNTAHLVDIRLHDNRLRVSLSMSGRDLCHRGIKTRCTAVASMREDLAAASLRWAFGVLGRNTREDPERRKPLSLYVPFAGSGTIGFEAAMLHGDIRPALFLPSLPCEEFLCTPLPTVRFLRSHSHPNESGTGSESMVFIESDLSQFEGLCENCTSFTRAGWRYSASLPDATPARSIGTLRDDFFSHSPEVLPPGPLFIGLNPPWGDRLGAGPSIADRFGQIGARLRTLTRGRSGTCSGLIFAPDDFALQKFFRELAPSGSEARHARSGGRPISLGTFWC